MLLLLSERLYGRALLLLSERLCGRTLLLLRKCLWGGTLLLLPIGLVRRTLLLPKALPLLRRKALHTGVALPTTIVLRLATQVLRLTSRTLRDAVRGGGTHSFALDRCVAAGDRDLGVLRFAGTLGWRLLLGDEPDLAWRALGSKLVLRAWRA